MASYEALLRRARDLAAGHFPHPNPRVGAVVVTADGTVIGEGAHAGAGRLHAEPIALRSAGEAARGATMVVTLEPHAHQGRTPPCTDAIIEAGISKVVVGGRDPNPEVSGRGIETLRAAGVEVVEADSAAVDDLDPGYFHRWKTGLPRIILKTAATLDGQTAAGDGTSRWITGPEAREDTHRLRARMDGVMVGAGTVIIDDPSLNVRLEGYAGHQPRPIVVAGRRVIPADAKLWERNPVVITPEAIGMGEEIVCESLDAGLRGLVELGIFDVAAEGGPTLARSLWDGGYITEGITYLAAALAGGTGRGMFDGTFERMAELRRVEITGVARVGSDVRVTWRPEGS